MTKQDFHVHTTYSDGDNSPEEMILAAIDKGMTKIGISDHSYTWFDETYCIPKERIAEYKKEIAALK
ncbi:MAG: PHP domain-containing protein, partial [Lachnospiraceae bacterium]|nr:PHP domain-containing protein [Lachnospiraceae bacterium]